MKPGLLKSGFTLIEMLLVVAIIAILVSMVVGITKHIDDQGKERLCRNTITLLGNALEQFRDFGYEYKDSYYDGLVFPLDCNGYDPKDASGLLCLNLQDTLRNALYSSTAPAITIWPVAQHAPSFSGSEAMYFILSQVPDCRTTLDKINKSLLTNKGIDKVTDIVITVPSGATTTNLPFTRIIDPWGTTLRYDYYPECIDYTGGGLYKDYRDSVKRTFPVITSAGPDKQFDTADDISNMK